MPHDTTTQTDIARLNEEHVARIKSLDSDTWDYLFDKFRSRLRGDIGISLQKQGLLIDDADDIEQQTWLVAMENIAHFDWQGEEKLYHWLRVIAKHLIYELRHDVERHVFFADFQEDSDDLEHFLDLYAHADDNVEEMVELRQRMAALEQALRILKPPEREIFVRRLLGERPRYLAAVYAMKEDSLRQMLQRAKKKVLSNLKYLGTRRDSRRFDD